MSSYEELMIRNRAVVMSIGSLSALAGAAYDRKDYQEADRVKAAKKVMIDMQSELEDALASSEREPIECPACMSKQFATYVGNDEFQCLGCRITYNIDQIISDF